MQQFWNELRQTARALAKSPGFTVAVVAIFASAVALETTTLSVVNAYLGRSLPYPAAERLYRIAYSRPGEQEPRDLELVDWPSLSDLVEERIAWDLDVFYMLGGEYPERVGGQWVTPGFTRSLGIAPAVGRSFRDEDFKPGAPQVALISNELWHSRFGGDSSILGKRFNAYVSDRPRDPNTFTIVGVLPSGFWHVNPYTQVLTPLRAPTYPYFVRLRDGVTPARVESRLSALIRRTDPQLPPAWQPRLESVHAAYTKSVRPLLGAVTAAVTLVLLIACANVILLVVLRGMKRRGEMAVRVALGASGKRIARLLAGESLLLCATAASAGALIAFLMLRAWGPAIEQQLGRSVPGGNSALAIDGRVGLIVVLLAIVMTLAISLPPLFIARRRPGGGLTSGSTRTTDGPVAVRARALLISMQIAGSFALLAGCALMVTTLRKMVEVRTGMAVGRTVEASLAMREHSDSVAFYDRLLATLRQAPGVGTVALSSPSPLVSYQPRRIQIDGSSNASARAAVRSVTADYFSMLGVGVKDGRRFSGNDRPGAEQVALISESLARSLWPESRAVGRRLRLYETGATSDDSILVTRTIVGVVADVRQSPTDSLIADVYVPLLQAHTRFAAIVAAPAVASVDWAVALRRAVRAVDAEAAVGQPQLISKSMDDQMRRPRFLASLFAAFGLIAFAIGVTGVYAVTAYSVGQREREIAVRVAIGADRQSVLRLFLRQAAGQLALGLVLGVFAAQGVGRLLAAELFGTAPVETATFTLVGALLGLAFASAVAWPAWRAAGVDPNASLRAP